MAFNSVNQFKLMLLCQLLMFNSPSLDLLTAVVCRIHFRQAASVFSHQAQMWNESSNSRVEQCGHGVNLCSRCAISVFNGYWESHTNQHMLSWTHVNDVYFLPLVDNALFWWIIKKSGVFVILSAGNASCFWSFPVPVSTTNKIKIIHLHSVGMSTQISKSG